METEFIRALQAGQQEAFKKLVATYQAKVYNTCLGFLKNTAAADDMSQEVFIEVHQSIAGFRADATLSTWVYRIAVNKCLEELRRKKRRQRWAVVTSLWSTREASQAEPVDFDHPGVTLENKERSAILMQHVDSLSENQRVAFVMHKVEGLPYEQIARIMNLSVAAVESLMVRAKANLKKSLAHYYQEE